jgi:membrane-associated phospholipid phosphatase
MDIDYLLLLQQFRIATNDIFTPFLENLSLFIIGSIPFAFFCLVYWSWDKKFGNYVLFSCAGARLVNGIVKLTACAYRPWIRDARVVPAGDSITTATGYSFPSGHVTSATTYYGSVALWQRKKHVWISIIAVVLLALTMFSRNYLGVHTPQDVLVGFGLTALVLFLNSCILAWVEGAPHRDRIVLIVGLVLAAAAILYINIKPYPMDYINGALVVDPVKMMPDSYQGIGFWIGFLIGWFVERNYIQFEIYANRKMQFLVSLVGLVPLLLLQKFGYEAMNSAWGKSSAKFWSGLLVFLYIYIVMPFVLKTLCRKKTADSPAKAAS